MIFHNTINIDSRENLEVQDITENVSSLVRGSKIDEGLVNLLCRHTTAALTINENDDKFWEDLINKFTHLAAIGGEYNHKPNAHAHILSCIFKPDTTIPVEAGKLSLGRWQRLLFLEFDGPRKRDIKVTIIGV